MSGGRQSLLLRALTAPSRLDRSTLQDIDWGEATPDVPAPAALLAALLYTRPDLVSASTTAAFFDHAKRVLRGGDPTAGELQDLTKLLELMATGCRAQAAREALPSLLTDAAIPTDLRIGLMVGLGALTRWRSAPLALDELLDLAAGLDSAELRSMLCHRGIEPLVFEQPEAFTPRCLTRIEELFSPTPRYRYLLYFLRDRPRLPAGSRRWLTPRIEEHFPRHPETRGVLCDGPVHVLVVQNLGMGLGDDVTRLAPLLQAMVDANPELRITLALPRVFLFEHPRIRVLHSGDTDALEEALAEEPEVVAEHFQPEAPGFTHNLALHEAIERHLESHRPRLLIRGDIGREAEDREGGRSGFLYQSVRLEGEELAAELELDRSTAPSNADPAMRLIAELGLPLRAGDEPLPGASVLTGTPSADAERLWRELAGTSSGGTVERPVALVSPFGGSGRTKGFYDQDGLVASEIEGLVDEGYRVVLLPNGQDWARRADAERLRAAVVPAQRRWVGVAPDPAEPEGPARPILEEETGLSFADRVIRVAKHFVARADLIVSVEGWQPHLALHLGRPFRLFPAAGSFTADWYPSPLGPSQRLVTRLSDRSAAVYEHEDLLTPDGAPPLPHKPRKNLLLLALPALGSFHDREDQTAALLVRARSSLDPDVRTAATKALGALQPVARRKRELLAALEDPWPAVVKEAASALLRAEVDCSRELGSGFRDLLQLEIDIAERRWTEVERRGLAALPALRRAASSDYGDVRDGAKAMVTKLLGPVVSRLRPTP